MRSFRHSLKGQTRNALLAVLFALLPFALFAQEQQPQFTPLPQDTALRYGKLPNGLTYYVRRNAYIPERASFYIAQNVGSILEEPSQRGLAHFLEHMAFNGSKHFPGKSMIDYLETIGVQFGANLNAYTGVDETVYMIKDVPVVRTAIVDSCLLILRDWSDGIALEGKEIDAERGVIEEEWRTRNSAGQRMLEAIAPTVYGSDKYADCMPIGNIDVVRNFKHKEIRNYYKKWYRPDLQGIIVVGDIDPDEVAAKIEKAFADCKMPKKAAERVWYPVSANDSAIVAVSTDKEMTVGVVRLFQKHDIVPFEYRSTFEYFTLEYCKALIANMVNERFADILHSPDSPFADFGYGDGEFILSKTCEAETYSGVADPSKLEASLVRILVERERIKRYGFTNGELQRAKDDLTISYTKLYNEKDKQVNNYFVQNYIDNFTSGEPAPDIELLYQMGTMLGERIGLNEINSLCMRADNSNLVLWISGPESYAAMLPAEKRVRFLIDSVAGAEIEPFKDDFEYKALVDSLPTAGSIAAVTPLPDDVLEYRLSNGVKVLYKYSTLKNDEVLMHVEGKGGMSLESSDDAVTMQLIPDLVSIGGLGSFSATELSKQLSGKLVDIGLSLGIYKQVIGGSSSVKDFETLLQLLYLNFTDLRQDDEAYASYFSRLSDVLKNMELYPAVEFNDSILTTIYGDNVFAKQLKYEDLQKLDYAKGLEIVKRRFANAAGMTFTFVGNVDKATFEELICKYIAVLPSTGEASAWKDCGYVPLAGKAAVRYSKQMAEPKTSVMAYYHADMPYTLENSMALSVLEQVLDMMYLETVREDEGGTYGVSVKSGFELEPKPYCELQMKFDTDAAKIDRLLPKIDEQLRLVAENGPSAAHLQKVKEYMAKVYTDNQKQNGYWLNVIVSKDQYGIDLHSNYLQTLNAISAETVKSIAAKIVAAGNHKEIVQIGN